MFQTSIGSTAFGWEEEWRDILLLEFEVEVVPTTFLEIQMRSWGCSTNFHSIWTRRNGTTFVVQGWPITILSFLCISMRNEWMRVLIGISSIVIRRSQQSRRSLSSPWSKCFIFFISRNSRSELFVEYKANHQKNQNQQRHSNDEDCIRIERLPFCWFWLFRKTVCTWLICWQQFI